VASPQSPAFERRENPGYGLLDGVTLSDDNSAIYGSTVRGASGDMGALYELKPPGSGGYRAGKRRRRGHPRRRTRKVLYLSKLDPRSVN